MHAYFYFLFPLKKAPRKKKTPSPKRLFNRAPIPGGYLQSSESMRQHVSLLYKGQLFFPPPPLAAIGNYITTRKAKRPDRRLKKKKISAKSRALTSSQRVSIHIIREVAVSAESIKHCDECVFRVQ